MKELEFQPNDIPLSLPAAQFLRSIDRCIDERFNHHPKGYQGFIPADYVLVYQSLATIQDQRLACGDRFCEWGSGLGAIAGLAAQLGFESYGIEIDSLLVDASRELAEEIGLDATYVEGSFIPKGSEKLIDTAYNMVQGSLSLDTSIDDAYEELGYELGDFDLVFVFPWPDDEELCLKLFKRHASQGALLLTYDQTQGTRLYRK